MKKFLTFVLAAFLVLAFTVPATAKTSVYGMITVDALYRDFSDEAMAGGVFQGTTTLNNGLENTTIGLPWGFNRFGVRYANEDKSVQGNVELRGGGNVQAGAADAIWYTAWIMWKFHPMLRLQVGRMAQTFSANAGGPTMGHQFGKTLLVGYGNIHPSNRDMIKLHVNFNEMIRLELSAVDPDNRTNDFAGWAAVPSIVANGEENTIPRLDAALNIKIGSVTIEPSLTWLTHEIDQVVAGNEDDFDTWGAGIFARGGFGMLVFNAEFTYGENFGAGNHVAGAAPVAGNLAHTGLPQAYVNSAGATVIEDAEVFAWFLQLGIKMGPATLLGYYGYQNADNDGSPLTRVDDTDVTHQAFGVALPISVAKGFTIRPELTFYDNDDAAQLNDGSLLSVDRGEEWAFGVQFMLVF
jgi:hypothetical protein